MVHSILVVVRTSFKKDFVRERLLSNFYTFKGMSVFCVHMIMLVLGASKDEMMWLVNYLNACVFLLYLMTFSAPLVWQVDKVL